MDDDWEPVSKNRQDGERRWVACIRPAPGSDLDAVLGLPLGLDVWEAHREGDDPRLIVAAEETQLAEIERRRLACVERVMTVTEFVQRAEDHGQS